MAIVLLLALRGSAAAATADPATVDFGSVPINTTASQVITITVDAGYSLAITSGSALNAPFSFDIDTCGAGSGFTGPGTCTVHETFSPALAAAASGTLNVFECPIADGSCIGISIPVGGTGVSTRAADPSSIDFGAVPINTSVSHAITITVDAGYRTEIASGTGISAPFGFSFDTCGAAGGFVGPGTCAILESFSPATAAASSGMTVVFECPIAGGSCLPITIVVSGKGAIAGAANPPAVAFGTVPIGTTATQAVSITIDAGYRAELASGSGIYTPFGFAFDTCGAGGGVTGPGMCTVQQRFSPKAIGAASGTTTVFECPVAGGSCLPIPYGVSGTGVTGSANPASVAFGKVPINTTATRAVTITVDAGYRPGIASGTGISAPFGFSFDTCGAGGGFIGPGTCTVQQSFSPTTSGAASGTTTVFECPVAGGSCLTIPYAVSGTGVTGTANPASVAFGNVPINTTASQAVTITVDAGYRTEIASGTGTNVPFGFSFDTCGAGGGFTGPGTCSVQESFSPTSAGASSGTTTVFECPVAGGNCLPIPYAVKGTGVITGAANPVMVAFGNVPINTTVTQAVTITVDAGYRTEIASGTGINAPFGLSFDACGAGGGFIGPGTCTVQESFSPTSAGASSGTTTVFECPVAGGSCLPVAYAVSGTGVITGAANPATVNFSTVPLNTTVSLGVSITVDAGYRAEIASGTGSNAPFGFSFDTCGAGGGFTGPGTCTVRESFSPTAVGPASGTTTVFECPVAGGSCLPIAYAVSGTGVSIVAASPASVAFGNVPVGTTATQAVTLTVDAGYRTGITSGGGTNAPFGLSFDACGAGGGFTGPGTCTVIASFSPTAAGASSGTTTVFECPVAGGTCLPIPYAVSGTGVSAAAASPASVAFGNVPINTTATQAVTITLDAGYRTGIASGSGTDAPFSLDFGACGGFTGPGTCIVQQRFTPTTSGPASGTTTVFECAPVGGSCLPILYAVSGAGVSARAASPASVNFGSVPIGGTATQPVTITADAGYRISIASGGGSKPPFSVALDTCDGFAGPGTCTIKERFTPGAVGPANGTLTVSECPVAGGACLGIDVALSGAGVSARAANPASVSFGNVPLNTTVTQTVTLTVDAGYRISAGSGGGINSPFSFALDACGAGGGFTGRGTCAIKESFTPIAIGLASGTLTVSECPVAGGSCLGIDIPLSGTGIAILTITSASLPNGIPGAPYPITALHASGGTPPIAWRVIDGSLPSGLTLNPATGTISGTPTAPRDHRHNGNRRDPCDGDGHDHWGRSRNERDRDDCDARDGLGEFTFTVAATDSGLPAHQIATKRLSITILGSANLALDMDAPASVQGRRAVTFTITVRNLGSYEGDAVVTDVLPAASEFVSAVTSQGHCSTPRVGSTGTVTCSLHTVEEGERATITITVEPTVKKGSITSTASVAVTGGAIDPVAANNTATGTVQVR